MAIRNDKLGTLARYSLACREGAHSAPRRSGAGQRAPASDGEGFGALPHLKHALGAHVAAVKIGYEQRESVDAFP